MSDRSALRVARLRDRSRAYDRPGEDQFPLVWHWRGHDGVWQRSCIQRKGQRCRRLCQGRNGNVLVEFEDGFRTVAPRHAVQSEKGG